MIKARLSRTFISSHNNTFSDTIDVELATPLTVGDTFFSCIEDPTGTYEYEGEVVRVHHFIHYNGNMVSEHRPMYRLMFKLIKKM